MFQNLFFIFCNWQSTNLTIPQNAFFLNPRKLVPTKLNEFTVTEILLKVGFNTITLILIPTVSANKKNPPTWMWGWKEVPVLFVQELANIIPAKLGSNGTGSFRVDDQNVKCYWWWQTMDDGHRVMAIGLL